jgi:hypothetical protein
LGLIRGLGLELAYIVLHLFHFALQSSDIDPHIFEFRPQVGLMGAHGFRPVGDQMGRIFLKSSELLFQLLDPGLVFLNGLLLAALQGVDPVLQVLKISHGHATGQCEHKAYGE